MSTDSAAARQIDLDPEAVRVNAAKAELAGRDRFDAVERQELAHLGDDHANDRGEYQRAGELAYGRIPELEKKLAEIEAHENAGEMMEEAVTAGIGVNMTLLVSDSHYLRTADTSRAGEIYAGRFAFAGKVVICDRRSPFEMTPPSDEWAVILLSFAWLRHLRAAESAITQRAQN